MKILLTFFVSFFSITNLFAQNSWELQNFVPGELSSVYFVDSLNGWAVSWNREIIHTTNGGKKWEYQKAPMNQIGRFYDVFFLNKNEGWICGSAEDGAILLHTTSSGMTWERNSNIHDVKYLYSVYFIDENNGWVGGDSGKILRTMNGGESWDEITVGPGNEYDCVGPIQFLDKKNGFALMGKSFIKTNDGGDSWQIKYTEDDYYYLNSMHFSDSLHGWIVGEIHKLLYTTDGGDSWVNNSPDSWYGYFTDVYFADTLNGIITGRHGIDAEKGLTYRTSDGGNTWTLNNEFDAINSISVIGQKDVWTVGVSSIYYSNNFGDEWKSQTSSLRGFLNSVYFLDEMHGWINSQFGITGGLYETIDGGTSWVKKLSCSCQDFAFINNKGWVIARDRIFHSDDNFNTWTEEPIQFFTGGAESIYFINENIGFCVGWSGPIIKTIDGGNTWEAIDTSKDYVLHSVYFLDENHGWAVGNYFTENYDSVFGQILRTVDGGQTWTEYITDDRFNLVDVFFIDENNGWAVGSNGDHYENPLLHTNDGGITWSKQSDFTSNSLNSVFFIDESTGWVTHSSGRIFKSIDGGETWNEQFTTGAYTSTFLSLNAVHFIDENIGWVVGERGTVLKTTNGGSTFVNNKESLQLVSSFRLYENFPNPFNPSTTIKYQIPDNGFVKLKVYDITGQNVVTLVNREQSMGEYEVIFNAAHLSSGVYLYRLEVSLNNGQNFTKAMKMILLR